MKSIFTLLSFLSFATVLQAQTDDCSSADYEPIIGGACENSVCTYDPFCCNNAWDAICAGEASTDPNCAYCVGGAACTDPSACNYNPNAVEDDGSCLYGTVGCLDVDACNYDPEAVCSGFCTYPGCTDPNSCLYNPGAGCDDGSCTGAYSGCTDPSACNYDPEATCWENTCVYLSICSQCTDPLACNFNETAIEDDGSCCYGPCLTLIMTDVFGDGWNSAVLIITDLESNVVFESFGPSAIENEVKICLEDGCYNITVSGGGFPSEIGWSLEGTNAGTISGGAPFSGSFAVGALAECGCTDPEACNYQPNANTDDGTCLYGNACWGCLDPTAVNYDDIALWDDGSCQYSISALVFYDTNGDGFPDENEPGLANHAVFVTETGNTIFSDEFGYFYLSDLPEGTYTLNLIEDTQWSSTNSSVSTVIVPSDQTSYFGLIPAGSNIYFDANFYSSLSVIHCFNGLNYGMNLQNVGEVALVGSLTMTFDEQFEIGTLAGAIPPDEFGPGYATWNIINTEPGSNQYLAVHFSGPGVGALGQTLSITSNLTLQDVEMIVFENEYNDDFPVACSYDPNDKQAEPIGYAEPHFILAGERIKYTIRFQNTGNYPAEDILVKDQLDASVFDLTTFEPVFASHNVNTIIHSDGMVDFIFDDIYLPDSVNDEPGSHGLVIFEIETLEDLAPGTVINNFADIYFEQNPPITTNTTWHTIFDCYGFDAPVTDNEICFGDVFIADATQEYVETYLWTMDGVNYDNMQSLEISGLETGVHDVTLTFVNPLCETTAEFDVMVHMLPEADAGLDAEICLGEEHTLNADGGVTYSWDNGIGEGEEHTISPDETTTYEVTVTNEFGCTDNDNMMIVVHELPGTVITENDMVLTGPDGVSWYWYFNGNLIEGATTQTLEVSEVGTYTVETTNEWGCNSISEDVVVLIGVGENEDNSIVVYPNPMDETVNIFLPEGNWSFVLIDLEGRMVRSESNLQNNFEMQRGQLESGMYLLRFRSDANVGREMKLVVK